MHILSRIMDLFVKRICRGILTFNVEYNIIMLQLFLTIKLLITVQPQKATQNV